MIITVDPTQSEDIAAFAMVKQYRMQALNVTLNGGTGSSAWQAVQGGEGYTQTVVTPVTGIELVYEDPNAIVSYTVENDDTSNYDVASNAGIILSSIEPTTNAWTYTCVFHADSVPVSSVDIDLLVYGNIARGTEQQGSPATAEEITAQVLARLETRVLALEGEMPTKADVATTYTKAETDTLLSAKANDNAVVHKAYDEDITGVKTYTYSAIGTNPARADLGRIRIKASNVDIMNNSREIEAPSIQWWDNASHLCGVINAEYETDGSSQIILGPRRANGNMSWFIMNPDYMAVPTPGSGAPSNAVATLATLDNYTTMVRTVNNQKIRGIKTHVIDDINTGILRIETPSSSGSGVIGVAFDFYESTTRVGYQYIRKNLDNSYQLILGIRNSDGTFTERAL